MMRCSFTKFGPKAHVTRGGLARRGARMRGLFLFAVAVFMPLAVGAQGQDLSPLKPYVAIPVPDIKLTATERAWIAEKRRLTFWLPSYYAPMSSRDANGAFSGIAVEYFAVVAQALGLEADYVHFDVLNNTPAALVAGEVDILPYFSRNILDQDTDLLFSDHYYEAVSSIFARGDLDRIIQSEQDLKGLRYPWVRGGFVSDDLRAIEPIIRPVIVESQEESMRAINSGDADAVVTNLATGLYQIEKFGLTNVKLASPSVRDSRLVAMAVAPDNLILHGLVNKVLAQMDLATSLRVRSFWLDTGRLNSARNEELLRIAQIIIVATLVCFAVAMVLWNRRLQAEIAERERIEIELINSKNMAESASRAKTLFLANLSHELRTPLNAIIGFSDMIRSRVFGNQIDRFVDYANDINRSGHDLLELIDELLNLSRIEARTVELELENVKLEEVVNTAIKQLRHGALDSDVGLSVDISEAPETIHVCRKALRQILINLVSNAIKFSRAGGQVKVRLRSTEAGGFVLTVSDDGIGIPDDKLQSVLKPFEQVANPSERGREGVGLGLAICVGLARAHGAELVIDSKEGEGTTGTVEFGSNCVVIPAA